MNPMTEVMMMKLKVILRNLNESKNPSKNLKNLLKILIKLLIMNQKMYFNINKNPNILCQL